VRAFNAIVVLVTIAMVGGRFLQERWTLAVIQQLSGERARDRYESMRRGNDRVLIAVTVLLACAAVVAIGYYIRFLSKK
jgi:hypothetical protein